MHDKREMLISLLSSAIFFLVTMWIMFYWLVANSEVDKAFVLMIAPCIGLFCTVLYAQYRFAYEYIGIIPVGYDGKIDWDIPIYILTLIVVYLVGCYLLSGSASFIDFINKYFIDVILSYQ